MFDAWELTCRILSTARLNYVPQVVYDVGVAGILLVLRTTFYASLSATAMLHSDIESHEDILSRIRKGMIADIAI